MAAITPEFTRPIRLDTLGDGGRGQSITADPAECAALARRFGIRAVDRLDADATLTRTGDIVGVTGRIVAQVTQACVATGEDVVQEVREPFQVRFVPASHSPGDEELELDEGALDDVTYTGSSVDLGEAAAQTLALALDPYPRAPDADRILRAAGVVREEDVVPQGALAGLRDLLGKRN